MSDQQPPPPPPPSAGGSDVPPAHNWAPLSASGQASYVGRAAGPTPAATTPSGDPAINKFAPKRSLVPLLVTVVTILIAAAVAYAAVNPPKLEPVSAPTPTPSVSSTPRPGTPFTVPYADTSGVWQITKHKWGKHGLDIYVEVSVDAGDLDCRFNALSNSGVESKNAQLSSLTPGFPMGIIVSGEKRSGWVNLPMTEHGTVLVFLHTPTQGQVSGIEVKG